MTLGIFIYVSARYVATLESVPWRNVLTLNLRFEISVPVPYYTHVKLTLPVPEIAVRVFVLQNIRYMRLYAIVHFTKSVCRKCWSAGCISKLLSALSWEPNTGLTRQEHVKTGANILSIHSLIETYTKYRPLPVRRPIYIYIYIYIYVCVCVCVCVRVRARVGVCVCVCLLYIKLWGSANPFFFRNKYVYIAFIPF